MTPARDSTIYPRGHSGGPLRPAPIPLCVCVRKRSRAPYRTPSACANRAAYPDSPPVAPHPELAVHAVCVGVF